MVDIPERTSPIHLIQEDYLGQAWPVLVSSIMLNCTTHTQVRPVLARFLQRWPSPEVLTSADSEELVDTIRALGFQNVRAKRLIDLAQAVSTVDPCTIMVHTLPGVGRYVQDAYTLFVKRELIQDVADKKLRRYVEWANGVLAEGVQEARPRSRLVSQP